MYGNGLSQYNGKMQQDDHHYYSHQLSGRNFVSKAFQKYGGLMGTVIKVTTDLTKAEVSFYYNEDLMCTLPLDKALTEYYDYYLFIEMGTIYDRVSFVSFTTDC